MAFVKCVIIGVPAMPDATSQNGDEESIIERYENDPFLRHDTKTSQSDMRIVAFYWHLRAVLSMAMEGASLIKQDSFEKGTWIFNLLRGTLPGIGEECQLKNCQRESVTRLSEDDYRSNSNPVCRRHYLFITTAVYGSLASLIGVAVSAYYVLMTI